MRTAIYYGRGDVRVEDRQAAAVGPDEIRVDVTACGICGTDLHEYADGPNFIPDEEPHPLTGETLPMPLGHEFSGTVTEVGRDVTDVAVDDAVAVHPILSCGECRYCEAGDYHVCERIGFVGTSGAGNGFAESTVVPAANAMVLPDDMPLDRGALVEPLSAAVHAVRRSGLQEGDQVAVFGAGPIGLLVLQAARVAGAAGVYVSEPRPARARVADAVGAEVVFDPTDVDVVERLRAETAGGVDVAFEVSGNGAALAQAIRGTRHGGHVTIVSLFEELVPIDPNELVVPERSINGTLGSLAGPRAGRGEFRTAARLLADGRVDPEPLVTSRLPLDSIGEGFERLTDPDSEEIKVLVEP